MNAETRSPARLLAALVVFAVVSHFTMSAALGAWSVTATGGAQAAAAQLHAPASASATANSFDSVSVSWQAPDSGPLPSGYRVVRMPATVVCAQVISSCTDTGLQELTTYTYAVQSRIGNNWVSDSAASSSTTTPVNGSFVLTLAAGPVAGSSVTATIQARKNDANDLTYNGTKTLTWSGSAIQDSPNGTAATLPSSASFNPQGKASVTITLTRAGPGTLTVRDAQGRTHSIDVTVAVAAQPLVLGCPATGPKGGDVTVTTSRPASDPYGNLTPGATVVLTAVGGTWVSSGATTLSVNLQTSLSSSSTLRLAQGAGVTTVTTDAPAGYTAGTCSITR